MNDEIHRLRAIFADPQFVSLFLVLGVGGALVYFFGSVLAPFLIALIFAYFLDGGVEKLTEHGMPRGVAVGLVFSAFVVVYVMLVVGPLQLVLQRAVDLALSLPANAGRLAEALRANPDLGLGILSQSQQQEMVDSLVVQLQEWLQSLVTGTIGYLPTLTTWSVYLFLVPLVVFFFLKDKRGLLASVVRLLPRERTLVSQIWREVEGQIGNYVRGKIIEIAIVGVVTWLVFRLLGFEYSAVMGLLAGVSVLIPYVGAIVVTIPVFIQGYLQWGFTWELVWLLVAYTVIQMLDGNVLVPLLFSEAVKLHPVTILVAVFIFGSLWGIVGAFFAIPLATLVKALVNAVVEFRDRTTEAHRGERPAPAEHAGRQ